MENSNSIINSLKRLERVGSETSVVTQKLKDAAMEVAGHALSICAQTEISVETWDWHTTGYTSLPDGIKYYQDREGGSWLLRGAPNSRDSISAEDICLTENISRDNALWFAQKIADGWLDKFTAYLDQLKVEAAKGLDALEKSLKEE